MQQTSETRGFGAMLELQPRATDTTGGSLGCGVCMTWWEHVLRTFCQLDLNQRYMAYNHIKDWHMPGMHRGQPVIVVMNDA